MKGLIFCLTAIAVCLAGFMSAGDCFAQENTIVEVSSPIVGAAPSVLDLAAFVPTPQGWKNLRTGEIHRREIYGFEVTDPADIAAYDREVQNRLTSMKIATVTKTTVRGEVLLASRCAGGRLLHSLFAPVSRVKSRFRCSSGSCS